MSRTAAIERSTKETQINLKLELDGTGVSRIDTGIGKSAFYRSCRAPRVKEYGIIPVRYCCAVAGRAGKKRDQLNLGHSVTD